jgi:transcriptional regulator with PAS, ATPase and Fis domain
MYLAEIRGTASMFADAISKILDIDVMIIDSDYHRIANTFKYVSDPTPITRYSIIGEVLYTGKVVTVDDKKNYEHCKNCPDLEECGMSGVIGVPIFFDGKVVGAIALLVATNKFSPIFENLEISIDFLERMADLLSSKLKNIDDYNKLNFIKKEREIIIDMIEDGLVFLNGQNEIVHFNHQFESIFNTGGEIFGKNIEELIDHKLIHEFLLFREDFSNKFFYYEYKTISYHGLLSCRAITFKGVSHGALFTFKSLGKVNNVLNEIYDNMTNISFNNIQGNNKVLMEQINKAKQLAVGNENILITGEPGLDITVIARAIHNYSDRSKHHFIVVDCQNTLYELLERETFGSESEVHNSNISIGKLRMAHKGTIFFKNISESPLYIQKYLVEVIKTKELKRGNFKGFNIDVRMIFSTNIDLFSLVKKGIFYEELYFRIIKNSINIPSLIDRKDDVKIIINNTISNLKNKHLKPQLRFSQDLLDKLYKHNWINNIIEIQKTLELIIWKAKEDTVTLEDVNDLGIILCENAPIKTVDVIEKELIERLCSQYDCKVEIAKALGIGRATLYRKLKKYGINA